MGAKNVKEENPPHLDFFSAITCSEEDDRGCMSGRACCDDTHTYTSMKCSIKSRSPHVYEPSRTIYYAPTGDAGDQVSTFEGDTPTTSTQKTVRSILRSGDQRSIAEVHGRMGGRIPSSAKMKELQKKNDNLKAQVEVKLSNVSAE